MPLTIASCERANAIPSEAVGSYEWGSVSGLTMTLLTATLSPPSCSAMLPQKFSAAATSSLPDDDVPEELVDAQPASATAPPSNTTASRRDGDLLIERPVHERSASTRSVTITE